MDERETTALERGWTLIARTLDALLALPLARGWLPAGVWAKAFGELRLAEAVARRLVIALGVECFVALGPLLHNEPPKGGQGKRRPSAPRPRGQWPAPHAAGFRLFDPLPSFEACLPKDMRDGPQAPAKPPLPQHPTTPRDTRGLTRRVAALKQVIENPEAAARRFALWHRARLTPRTAAELVASKARRIAALRPGHPPGYRRSRWLDFDQDVLLEADWLARNALASPRFWRCPS